MSRAWLWVLPIVLLAVLSFAQAPARIKIHGLAEDSDGKPVQGVKLEFMLRGEPKKEPIVTGPDGRYEAAVVPGMYDILAHMPDTKVPPFSGEAWLSQADTTLNVRVPKGKTEPIAEYDFLGEWRVVDEKGHGIGPAGIVFEAQERAGERSRFPVFVETADGEKETDGATNTDPAGRLPLRVAEAHLRPDRVVAMVVTVELNAYQPRVIHLYPELQFSASGHLYPVYPEEFTIQLTKR
jgi:hypothetical protein